MNEHSWASWEEWRSVRALLYSKDPYERRHGCHRVSAWMVRGMNTPLPIRCTSDLVEAQLLDELGPPPMNGGMAATSAAQVRLAYAMALVRLVNNAADDGQRGEYAQSVATLAQRIGLPKWLVDVRHESTHQRLPTLEVLRLATAQALRWLDEHYWSHQNEEIDRSQNLDSRFDQLAECIEAGKIKRSVGPFLPVPASSSKKARLDVDDSQPSSKEEEDDEEGENGDTFEDEDGVDDTPETDTHTAQDLVFNNLRRYDHYALAKALFRCLSRQSHSHWEPPFLIHWERILHWLDGEMDLRVSRKLVMVCIKEHLLGHERALGLLKCLLSRRFHMENRTTLGKMKHKTLSIEEFDTWTEKEHLHMRRFAADVFVPELSAGLKLCLKSLDNPLTFPLIEECILPILMQKHSQEEKTNTMNKFRSLAKLKRMMRGDKTDEDDLRTPAKFENSLSIDDALKFIKEQTEDVETTDEADETKQIQALSTDGNQSWTKVLWPGVPVGACIDNPMQCPALKIAPILIFNAATHETPQSAPADSELVDEQGDAPSEPAHDSTVDNNDDDLNEADKVTTKDQPVSKKIVASIAAKIQILRF